MNFPNIPDEHSQAVHRFFDRVQAALKPGARYTATTPDGFRVSKIGFNWPFLELQGFTASGDEGARIVHFHQLDLQITFIGTEQENPGVIREMGYHTIKQPA